MIFCNCYVWVLYAYLVNNILPLFVNCCLEMFTSLVFGAIYFRWSTSRPHVHKVCAIAFPGLVAHTIYYIVGTSGVTNQSDDAVEKVLGVLSDNFSIFLFASPLEAMKQVIQTKDATSLPIIISAIFLTNTTIIRCRRYVNSSAEHHVSAAHEGRTH
ncbi:hypothetical protein PC121_g14147 [Phytophthora cactorum]|nr:hypothetical protein PC120_g8624 [Phytophthora cactorum]KAG3058970.1 hypothetical protein PC121_g14147 [Phytophthora cactorum]KAG4052289.1 hypothetical protein PC123_g12509 [Phytophthora cactorum]